MSYVSYFLSAYALTIVCVRTPGMVKGVHRLKEENRYVHRYVTDVHLRTELSLYLSLGVNVLYALLQLISGLQNRSVWFYSLAGYYVLLAVVRFFLLRDTRHLEFGKDIVAEYRRYRFCGIILLLVNLALGVIVTYIVWQNRGFVHHEIVTIAMAAYTFYSMARAIINVLKYRRHESPILLASKSISLTAALVSLLSLETAMLTAFGNGDDPRFRQIMTASTGGVICLWILAMAVYMIVRGTKEIRLLTKGTKENGSGE
ncbi:MAG: hypothetical protein J6I64_04845 [Lachnospiraceae bacterium]|nr:hypothetical protein [Lachnospiraceae bacterium]